jgi:recombination protein RecA
MKNKKIVKEAVEETEELDEPTEDSTVELDPIAKLTKIANKIRKAQKDINIVMMRGDKTLLDPIEFIPTGSLLLDQALGGGMPKGRLVEVYGLEGGGKTAICLGIIAQAQKRGLNCQFIDAECAFVEEWAANLGVNLDFLLLSQLSCTEDVFNLVETSIDSGVDVIIVDSLAALSPRAELDGEVGDYHVGLQARLVGQAMRKINEKASKSNTLVIFINQIRLMVGVMYGNPETTPGGKSLKFYSSIRLDVRARKHLKNSKGDTVGVTVGAYVAKNKVALPFKRVELDFYFNKGFDNEVAVFEMAASKDVLIRKGAYYVFPKMDDNNRKREEWLELFRTDPSILKIVVSELNNKPSVDTETGEVFEEGVEDETSNI